MTEPPVIEAERLRKAYGDKLAVERVDLAVPPGTVLGVLGPNGAGKSTTVRMLTTMTAPDAGVGRVAGHDVAREADAVRRLIGVTGQDATLDELLTGTQNLVMVGELSDLSRRASQRRAAELLDRFELTDAADRMVKTYSGGMRRRLDLAASLVAQPRVLFLDEPTTGLDPTSRLRMWDVVRGLVADGTTVLLTTQYLKEADRLADHIVVMDRGQIIAEGTAVELKASLGATVVEIRLTDPATAQRAAARLQRIAPSDVLDGRRAVAVQVPDNGPAVQQVIRLLDADAIVPDSLAIREPTLDDVFLQLTGHRAGIGPGANPGSA